MLSESLSAWAIASEIVGKTITHVKIKEINFYLNFLETPIIIKKLARITKVIMLVAIF